MRILVLAIPAALVIGLISYLLYNVWYIKWRDRKINSKAIAERNLELNNTLNAIEAHAKEHQAFGDPLATIIIDEISLLHKKELEK